MDIRGYEPRDQPRLYEICLRTGDAGHDATGQYADPELIGHAFVGPYLALAPELAFVLDLGDGVPVGYALGALDTDAFTAACERSWWPALRRRYPDPADPRTPDERIAALIHHPPVWPAEITARYPSHLHIDLLPEAQGRGHGRALMARLLRALAEAGSPGVHLGVARTNQRAIGFYRRLGFVELGGDSGGLTMGLPLETAGSPR
jgi:ribosomal protein S18 acetylase RimI-like enzyme